MTAGFIEISNVLNQLLTTHGISESELGRKTSIPRATINRLVNGTTPDPRASTLEAIAYFFNISVDQLLGKQPLSIKSNTITANIKYVPVIAWSDIKDWKNIIENAKTENHSDWVTLEFTNEVQLFAVKVQGESMWPNFQENTILIVNPGKEPQSKNFVIAYLKEMEEIIFRQLIIDGSYKVLKAINNIFPPIQINKNDEILGVIIQTRNSYE